MACTVKSDLSCPELPNCNISDLFDYEKDNEFDFFNKVDCVEQSSIPWAVIGCGLKSFISDSFASFGEIWK